MSKIVLSNCPWCDKEILLNKDYVTSDPNFIFFVPCSHCSIFKNKYFRWGVNQKDCYIEFKIEMDLSDRGVIGLYMDLQKIEYQVYIDTYTYSNYNNDFKIYVNSYRDVIFTQNKIITPPEAKNILIRYEKLKVFI